MKQIKISVLMPVKNAARTLEQALESVSWADERVVLDDDSDDGSLIIAREKASLVLKQPTKDFAEKRNLLMKKAKHEWILYLDADEIITPALEKEIVSVIQGMPAGYFIRRRNFFLGKEMYSDKVERLFHKSLISGWEGEVHEHAVLVGGLKLRELNYPLLHYTHQQIRSMLQKTNQWSEYEAGLRWRAKHPKIVWWRLIRIGATYFYREYWGKKLYKFGREGLFEAYFQMIDKLIVYIKLWERQKLV